MRKENLFLVKKIKATCLTIKSLALPSIVGATAKSKTDMTTDKTVLSTGTKITEIFYFIFNL